MPNYVSCILRLEDTKVPNVPVCCVRKSQMSFCSVGNLFCVTGLLNFCCCYPFKIDELLCLITRCCVYIGLSPQVAICVHIYLQAIYTQVNSFPWNASSTVPTYTALESGTPIDPENCFHSFMHFRVYSPVFLALLDYVSRAHKIQICPSSVRPTVASIISEVIAWMSFKF